jgi:hypothetical protein
MKVFSTCNYISELKNTETDTMPEFRQQLKGKKLTSTPKKRVVKNVDTVDTESDRSSDG